MTIWRVSVNRNSQEPVVLWIAAESQKQAEQRFNQLVQRCRQHSDNGLSFDEGTLKHTANLDIAVSRVKNAHLYERFIYFEKGECKLKYD